MTIHPTTVSSGAGAGLSSPGSAPRPPQPIAPSSLAPTPLQTSPITSAMKIRLPDGTERRVYFIVTDPSTGRLIETTSSKNPEILRQCTELFQKLVEAVEPQDGSPARIIESVSFTTGIKYSNGSFDEFRSDNPAIQHWRNILSLLLRGTPETGESLSGSLSEEVEL